MKTKSLSLTFLMLLLSACSPFTIVSSSGEQPTQVEESMKIQTFPTQQKEGNILQVGRSTKF
jgi:hypothetical protein